MVCGFFSQSIRNVLSLPTVSYLHSTLDSDVAVVVVVVSAHCFCHFLIKQQRTCVHEDGPDAARVTTRRPPFVISLSSVVVVVAAKGSSSLLHFSFLPPVLRKSQIKCDSVNRLVFRGYFQNFTPELIHIISIFF